MNNHDNFKSTPANPNLPKTTLTPELEARVVAWVLGEASPFEASELAQRCAEQPELAVFKRRIEAVHGLVGAVERPHGEPLRLSPERRAKLLAVIGTDSTGKPSATLGSKTFATSQAGTGAGNRRGLNWRAWMGPLAACVGLLFVLSAVLIPTVGRYSKKAAMMSDARLFDMKLALEKNEQSSQAEVVGRAEGAIGGAELSRRGGAFAGKEQSAAYTGVSVAYAPMPPSAPMESFAVDGLPEKPAVENFALGGMGFGSGSAALVTRSRADRAITGLAKVKSAIGSETTPLKPRLLEMTAGADDLIAVSAGDKINNSLNAEVTPVSQLQSTDADEAKRENRPPVPSPDSLRVETPTTQEAISTFSLHVSDASFRLTKAALARGEAPDPQTIRPEEFYNAFDYGDPAPLAREPVACRIEQAAHPFLQQRNLVRIALQVPASGRGAGQPLRLTVLLDTSGSMERDDRVESVRAALTSLTSLLGPNDRVSLIGFARTPRLLAENLRGDQAARLVEIAAHTPAEGGTNLEEAVALAGKLALRHHLEGAQNRIVLLTDGAANLGNANPAQLAAKVTRLRQQGIAFDACGVVADGLDDTVLEALTRQGDGRYTLINAPEEADASFARQLAGAFRPAAKDVKVQVRFNPARVARYRLIGFEQHRLKTEDFRNDAIDAAELAAEEAAVALYQVEVKPDGEGELGEVSVRFRELSSGQIVERSWPLNFAAQAPAFNSAAPSMQLAGSAAFLAEKLRGGALAGQVQLAEFAPVVEGLSGRYPQAARVQDLIQMFRQTRRLTGE